MSLSMTILIQKLVLGTKHAKSYKIKQNFFFSCRMTLDKFELLFVTNVVAIWNRTAVKSHVRYFLISDYINNILENDHTYVGRLIVFDISHDERPFFSCSIHINIILMYSSFQEIHILSWFKWNIVTVYSIKTIWLYCFSFATSRLAILSMK